MQADEVPPPGRVVDGRGRLIPMTEAEVKARAPRIARALDALDEMGDEQEQGATLESLSAALGFPTL